MFPISPSILPWDCNMNTSKRPMPEQSLVAEFASVEQGKAALERLIAGGFQSDAVTLVWRDHDQALAHVELSDKGTLSGAAEAAAFGGLMVASLTIPVMSGSVLFPVLVVVPFAMFASGAVAGLLIYEVAHAGDHAKIAKSYHQRLRAGSALIIVSGSYDRLRDAEALLRDLGAKSIAQFKQHKMEAS